MCLERSLSVLMVFEQLLCGGFETHLYSLCKYLRGRGHQITLHGRLVADVWKKEYADLGIGITLKPEQGQYDVIHAHPLLWGLLRGHELSLRLSRPLVVTYHGPYLEAIQEVRRGASAIIAVSQEVYNCVGTGQIIENGIDLDNFAPVPHVNCGSFVASYVGRLTSERCAMVEALIDACEIAGAKCEIIGADQWPGMRQLDRKYEDVIWHGAHMDTRALVARSDVVFSTGRGVREAMSMGRPAVVLNSMGYDGLVTPENVELLRTHNFSGRAMYRHFSVQAIADDIMVLKNNKGFRKDLTSWGVDYAKRHFALHDMALHTETVYRDVLVKHARNRAQ